MSRSAPHAPASSLVDHAPALMVAGAVGAHLALLLATVAAGVMGGTDGAVSTLLSGLSVSILWILGQQLQLVMVQRADMSAMAMTLGGFAFRAAVLGGAMAFWLANVERFPALTDWAIALGCVAVAVGWLVGLLWRYSRTHIPIYDRGYVSPGPGSSPD